MCVVSATVSVWRSGTWTVNITSDRVTGIPTLTLTADRATADWLWRNEPVNRAFAVLHTTHSWQASTIPYFRWASGITRHGGSCYRKIQTNPDPQNSKCKLVEVLIESKLIIIKENKLGLLYYLTIYFFKIGLDNQKKKLTLPV